VIAIIRSTKEKEKSERAVGSMYNASTSGAGDSGFDSHATRF
jgi:hypothetical protein